MSGSKTLENKGNPAISLDCDVWSIDHIATYTYGTRRSALRLTRRAGFPQPIHTVRGEGRWLAEEVKDHLRRSRVQMQGPVTAAPTPIDTRSRARKVSA